MTDIIAEMEGLNRWQRVALASMCAASTAPVVVRFGQRATRQAFEQGLEAAWNSALSDVTDPRVASVRRTLDDLTESACDDSNAPGYEVMRAIAGLACTLDAILHESGRSAIDACVNVIESYSGYDYVSVHGVQTRRIDPRNPPPPGPLQSLLIELQLRSIEAMRDAGHDRGQVVGRMQAFGNRLAAELDLVLPGYAERRGWSI